MKDKRKIVLIAVIAVLVIAAAVVLLLAQRSNPLSPVTEPKAEPTAEPTTEPTAEPAEATTEEPEASAQPKETKQPQEQPFLVQITEDDPSVAYVLVRMPDPVGLLPLPTEGEYTRTITQAMPDGTEAINVLHLTTNGVWMEDANCEGHDCVKEGEVTLENRETRVLWNMIICLPHQLSLELITRDEALSLLSR